MISVEVLLFAGLREALGPRVRLELPDDARARDVVASIAARHPAATRAAVARNRVVVALDEPLAATDEVALLPPVGGG